MPHKDSRWRENRDDVRDKLEHDTEKKSNMIPIHNPRNTFSSFPKVEDILVHDLRLIIVLGRNATQGIMPAIATGIKNQKG